MASALDSVGVLSDRRARVPPSLSSQVVRSGQATGTWTWRAAAGRVLGAPAMRSRVSPQSSQLRAPGGEQRWVKCLPDFILFFLPGFTVLRAVAGCNRAEDSCLPRTT